MSCEYCGLSGTHRIGCPNYHPPKATHYCFICEEGIFDGEEYVENLDDEYAHYDCLTDISVYRLIRWFGLKVKTMGNEYEKKY